MFYMGCSEFQIKNNVEMYVVGQFARGQLAPGHYGTDHQMKRTHVLTMCSSVNTPLREPSVLGHLSTCHWDTYGKTPDVNIEKTSEPEALPGNEFSLHDCDLL